MTQVAAGLHQPTATSAKRRPGSIRRTAHVDMRAGVDGDPALLRLTSAARDQLTRDDCSTETVSEASVRAVLGAQRRLVALDTDPGDPGTAALLDRPVASGFRAAVADAVPEHHRRRTLLYRLLEELPVAALISGYADLYLDRVPAAAIRSRSAGGVLPADICAGWQSDGSMMTAIAETGRIPVPMGPPAPELDADDIDGWHAMPSLAAGAMRRRRLLDVRLAAGPDRIAEVRVEAMFRDSHVEPGGAETVLHQYDVQAVVDPATRTVLTCAATPRVLPWIECPRAAASAGRLAGHRVDEIPGLVKEEFRGTSTCTHLNDLLRTLGDVGALLDALEVGAG